MDLAVALAALVLLALTAWRARSIAWATVLVVSSFSLIGIAVNWWIDRGQYWSATGLRWLLLLALALPAILAWLVPAARTAPRRRQLLATGVPVALAGVIVLVVTTVMTAKPAFVTPVAFLMGHANAEDNAKWLDFAAQFAQGGVIQQAVPLGGPLQLLLVLVASGMGAVSQLALGGYNEVAVAANTVIGTQFALVVLAPLALAPLAEAALASPRGKGRMRVPIPALWLASAVLASAVLVVTGYGHLTFQVAMIVTALWSATFLADLPLPRARLLTSLAVAASMAVWLPLNGLAILILLAVMALTIRRAKRGAGIDWLAISLTAWIIVALWIALRSSVSFVLNSGATASGEIGTMPTGGLAAAVPLPGLSRVASLLDNAGLFGAPGGTEPIGPILAILAFSAAMATAFAALRQRGSGALRLVPLAALSAYAIAIYVLDAWVTGSAPNYGSLKFGFLAVIVALATGLPLAITAIDPDRRGMTPLRWSVLIGTGLLLMVDTLVPRAIAAIRPEQWSPPLPYSNTQAWWAPAEVNGTGSQPISGNPIGCVYLPNGAEAPSAILASQLSGGDRVYACSRILAGLGGADSTAQPLVDWLRAEWLMNTPAWEGKRGYLAEMPEGIRQRPVILLGDMSDVIGLETVDGLLARYP